MAVTSDLALHQMFMCLRVPIFLNHRCIALGGPELTLTNDVWEFGNPRWRKWIEVELLSTMFKDPKDTVEVRFMESVARKAGTEIALPENRDLGLLLIFLPCKSKGGVIRLTFDGREAVSLETTSPDQFIAIVL